MPNRRRQKPAPSTSAASLTSAGMAVSPAMRITVASGRTRHVCSAMIDPIARPLCPRKTMWPPGGTMPSSWANQSNGLKIEIQHPQPDHGLSATGVVHGNRIRKPHEPPAAEIGCEDESQDRREQHHEQLRESREDESVAQRGEEDRVLAPPR